MNSTIEQRLCQSKERADLVRSTFQETFATDAGRRCLALLVEGAHPMGPRHGDNFLDGECTTVGFLWRYGSQLATLPEPKTTDENAK